MIKLSVENLSKFYKVGEYEIKALDNVSFGINDGELVSVIGPSGSGKSTLMNMIGLLDSPSEGRIFIDGRLISSHSERELALMRNNYIGFVFQSFNLLGNLNALENVELPLMYKGLGKRKRTELALQMLERVGMSERRLHYPSQLSGGQKQRVAIARALVTNPSLILADEPTGALDSATADLIMKMFEELNNEGKTVIIVTHSSEVAARTKTKIEIKDGKILRIIRK